MGRLPYYLLLGVNVAVLLTVISDLVTDPWLPARAVPEQVPMGTALAMVGYLLVNAVALAFVAFRED